MGKGLKVGGSSDGPTVVGGVVGETGGRRQDGLVARLCRRTDDGKSPISKHIHSIDIVYIQYIPVQLTCSRIMSMPACMERRYNVHTLLYTEIQIEGGNEGVN